MSASPGSPANPIAFLDAQAKAKEDALAKILTPDQLATYHQQAQAQLDMQKSMMQNYLQRPGPSVLYRHLAIAGSALSSGSGRAVESLRQKLISQDSCNRFACCGGPELN